MAIALNERCLADLEVAGEFTMRRSAPTAPERQRIW
jgi:hypothetical protein